MTLANYLYSLVYSNVYGKEMWIKWAVGFLESLEYTEETEWIFNVAFAQDKSSLFDAIYEKRLKEDFMNVSKYTLTEIIQGYYFYLYKNEKIDLYFMIKKSGDVADEQQNCIGCEFFYNLLNQIDKNSEYFKSNEFIKTINSYYYPRYSEAIIQKTQFESATISDL